jgi:hypothetical protein
MFVSHIVGPNSEDEFAARCADIVLPSLSERQITAAPWTGNDGFFYLRGFREGDPSEVIRQVLAPGGWQARTVNLSAVRNPVGLPGGTTIDCVMPNNVHAIGRHDTYRTCSNKHRITAPRAAAGCVTRRVGQGLRATPPHRAVGLLASTSLAGRH